MKETDVKRKKFVPYEKSSKKERKDRDKLKRNEWDFPPITKVIPDKRKRKLVEMITTTMMIITINLGGICL